MIDDVQQGALLALLKQAGLGAGFDRLTPLAGDGSDRPFFRVAVGPASYLAAFPSPTLAKARAEARAAFHIGRHFWQAGVPVPEILAYDEASGAILFEDLGERLLFNEVRARGPEAVAGLYRQAVTILADLQLGARPGFTVDWCWDTPCYDRQLMIERESNYFAREFCLGHMGLAALPHGLAEEFARLADRIGQATARGVMHRDYQSRNLMVQGEALRVIDFQGARLGPLAYDLASLLNDPYVTLPEAAKAELLDCYLQRLGAYISLDRASFMDEYYPIALQRNLQVLGAYAFLTRVRGKEFFRQYIGPALERLSTLLASQLAADYPVLNRLLQTIAALRRENERPHVRR